MNTEFKSSFGSGVLPKLPSPDQKLPARSNRLWLIIALFVCFYASLAGKLVWFAFQATPEKESARRSTGTSRPDIVDRNGAILAIDLHMVSLFAEPNKLGDIDDTLEQLSAVLPELDPVVVYEKMKQKKDFVWIARQLSPRQQQKIHDLGLAGIGFIPETKRFYPAGNETSHVVGLTNLDNIGIAGMEKWIDNQGLSDLQKSGFAIASSLAPVVLSLDLRVQHIMHDELSIALKKYQAVAAGGVILNVQTGEVLGMVSLPDFDPNNPAQALEKDNLNRMSAGTFEMGSTIKTFTSAMALEIAGAELSTVFDASKPLTVGRQRVRDPHSKGRPLTLTEVFLFSSNIGSAHEALAVGMERHREFLRNAGLLTRLETELPEVATPVQPRKWTQPTSITASFGHGFATTPLQTAVGIGAMLNGGILRSPTFLSTPVASSAGRPIVSTKTSETMRYLYRLNAIKGSGRKANIAGFRVGGKTGTAEKVINGKYAKHHNFNAFASAFPMDNPQFVLLVIIDDPKPERSGMGITAAANAAPVAAEIIRRTALILGVVPSFEQAEIFPKSSTR